MPKIIEITIGLATSFNNPFESYSNFKPSVQLKAIVADGEDPKSVALDLQFKAGELLAAERHRILDGLKQENELDAARRNVEYAKTCVGDYEQSIAELTAKLTDATWRQSAQPYEVENAEHRLKNYRAQTEDQRTKLAEAQKKLADLIGL